MVVAGARHRVHGAVDVFVPDHAGSLSFQVFLRRDPLQTFRNGSHIRKIAEFFPDSNAIDRSRGRGTEVLSQILREQRLPGR
jgi:hypothetical protein